MQIFLYPWNLMKYTQAMLTHAQGTRWRMPVIIRVMQSAGSWLKPVISICGKEVVHWVLLYPYTLRIHIISWPWRIEQSPSVRLIISWCNELRPGAMSYMFKVLFQWYCLILWKYVYPFQTLVKFVARFSEVNKSHLVHACSVAIHYLRQWWPLFLTYICVTQPQRINHTVFVPEVILHERNWKSLYWQFCCRFV